MDSIYYVSPDISPWVFMTSVVVMVGIGILGVLGNSAIIITYLKNKSVNIRKSDAYHIPVNIFSFRNIYFKISIYIFSFMMSSIEC